MTSAPRFVSVALAVAEGIALLVVAVGESVALVAGGTAAALPVAAFFTACSAAVLWCARGLARGQSWSRGPLVATQLLLLALSWTYHRPYPVVAVTTVAVAVVALVGLVLPSTTRTLSESSDTSRA